MRLYEIVSLQGKSSGLIDDDDVNKYLQIDPSNTSRWQPYPESPLIESYITLSGKGIVYGYLYRWDKALLYGDNQTEKVRNEQTNSASSAD